MLLVEVLVCYKLFRYYWFSLTVLDFLRFLQHTTFLTSGSPHMLFLYLEPSHPCSVANLFPIILHAGVETSSVQQSIFLPSLTHLGWFSCCNSHSTLYHLLCNKSHLSYIYLILSSFLECKLHENKNHTLYHSSPIRKYSIKIIAFFNVKV